jgi:hypothetical protein
MISHRSNLINLIIDFILDAYNFASTTQQRDNSEEFFYYDSTTGRYHLGAEGLIFDINKPKLSICTLSFNNLGYN